MPSAFVLAAGLGTRLAPLTELRPKPLVPVCGVPMLSYALALCARHGLHTAVVNTHHLAEAFGAWTGQHEGVDIVFSHERGTLLGTGGGLRHARHLLDERFVVVNADTLCDVDLGALLSAVRPGGAAMALRHQVGHPYRPVLADRTDTVVEIRDRASAAPSGPVAADTHFTGVHALHREVLPLIPPGPQDIITTVYTTLVPQRRVAAVRHAGTWLDVGDPAAYLTTNLAVLTTTIALPLDPVARAAWARTARGDRGGPPPGVRIEGSAWVGRDAVVHRGALLRDTVVGDRAVVSGDAVLERCVVWDGVTVPGGHWRNLVWTERGVVAAAD